MYFTYNGVSSESMKIKIIEFSPPGKSEEEIEGISVPGRATEITNRLGRYKNIKKTAKFALFERSMYRSVLGWLSGEGKLIFSDESDKYYNVYMTGAAETERICNSVLEFEIKIIFEPFAHSLNSEPINIGTSYTSVDNNGSIYSEPVITFAVTPSAAPILMGDVNDFVNNT